tara:strand:+ start:68 stop:427 length:360 start_codon:yes stop_codon:yes gene_type:complete
MDLRDFVLGNQKVLRHCNDRTPGETDIDMLYGTLDYATARFHTILIKLSQDALAEAENRNKVKECFDAIQSFYKYTLKYQDSSVMTKWFYRLLLHRIGKRRIPKIKILHDKLITSNGRD